MIVKTTANKSLLCSSHFLPIANFYTHAITFELTRLSLLILPFAFQAQTKTMIRQMAHSGISVTHEVILPNNSRPIKGSILCKNNNFQGCKILSLQPHFYAYFGIFIITTGRPVRAVGRPKATSRN